MSEQIEFFVCTRLAAFHSPHHIQATEQQLNHTACILVDWTWHNSRIAMGYISRKPASKGAGPGLSYWFGWIQLLLWLAAVWAAIAFASKPGHPQQAP
jgi:hypothetical protein